MSEANKQLLRRFVQTVLDGQDVDAADQFLAPNFVHHDQAPGEETGHRTGREGFKRFLGQVVFSGFSEFRTTFHELLAEGDLVAGRWTQNARNTGRWLGQPPTRRQANVSGISIVRIRGGRIIEEWEARDALDLLRVVGLAPPPTPLENGSAVLVVDALERFRGGPLVPGGLVRTLTNGPLTTGIQPGSKTNKALVSALLLNGWSRGDFSVYDQIVAPEAQNHGRILGQKEGKDGLKQFADRFRRAFPDATVTVDLQVAEGDKVATRWTAQGTHRDTFLGVQPTGRRVSVTGIDISRLRQGRVVEKWGNWEQADLLGQLGVLAPP